MMMMMMMPSYVGISCWCMLPMYVSSNSLEGALADALGDNFLDDSCRPAWKTDATTQSFPKKKQWCADLFWIVLQKSFLKQTFVFSEAIAASQCRNKWFLWVIPTNKHWAFFFLAVHLAVHLAYILMFYLIFDVAYIQTFLCDIFSGHFSDEQTDILFARYSDILSYTHSDMLSKVLPDICLLGYEFWQSRFWHSVWGTDKISSWKCVGCAPREPKSARDTGVLWASAPARHKPSEGAPSWHKISFNL